jgi:hypothetical protein
VVFSPSGTDTQLQALWLAGALLGRNRSRSSWQPIRPQRNCDTARGNHFSAATTAHGSLVRKGEPIAGFAHSVTSVGLPLLDEADEFRSPAETDAQVLRVVQQSVANGTGVLLQIMDSSKDHGFLEARLAAPE